MNEKKQIAAFLLEIAKNSTTEFIDDAKVDKEMIDVAKKLGMIIPSPDFALFRTTWAEIDKANLNGVRLPRKAVEEGLDTFLFKQVNFEHKGAYNMCGITLSVKMIDERIETINVFYKSLYPNEFIELKEKIKSGEAAVSFEIWNKDPDTGKSVVKELADGTKEITKIIVHGTGLLLVSPPACPRAKIFSLIAKKELKQAEQIVDKIFDTNLVYASLAIPEPTCINCGNCPCGKKVKVVIKQIESKEWICPHCEKTIGEKELFCDADQKWYHRPCQEKGEIILPEETANEKEVDKVDKLEKSSEEPKIEVTAEETKTQETAVAETKTVETPIVESTEVKVEAAPEIAVTAEVKAETTPEIVVTPEVKAQELQVIEPKIVAKVTRISSDIYVDTYVDGTPSGTSEGKSAYKTITEYADGTQDVVESESEYKKKYDFAELEKAVNDAQEELIAAFPKEVTDCVKQKTKDGMKPADAVKECWKEYKTKQADAMAEEVGKKDKEITILKQELGTKDQEINELKGIKKEKEDNSQPSLDVGRVNSADAYKTKRESIDKKAFGEKK